MVPATGTKTQTMKSREKMCFLKRDHVKLYVREPLGGETLRGFDRQVSINKPLFVVNTTSFGPYLCIK